MNGSKILNDIVVKISSDKKEISGTGFFISGNEIATCYHVLSEEKSPLQERYYVKNDSWNDWMETKPLTERCDVSKDVAILQSPVPLELKKSKIRIAPWNGETTQFISCGYDIKAADVEGTWTINEESCKIIAPFYLGPRKRLQLSSRKGTLLPGRSGSPVWSVNQKAIVGMIDYQGGEENVQTDRSTAIPIEMFGIEIPMLKGEPINVPGLPADFLPRQNDLDRLKELILSKGESRSAITGKIPSACNCSAPSVGLQGMGGIGKSVLAAALARDDEVLEAFPDGVIWIALGHQSNQSNLPNRQLQLLQFLDKDHRPVKDVPDGLGCLRILLREKSCLIILDDVWTMDDVRAFDALGPNCRMLITTRDQKIVRELGAREFCLDMLSEADSMQLLALTSGLPLDRLDPKAREVAEECDRLPLALAMVGSIVKAARKRDRPDPWEYILHRLRAADLDKINVDFPNYQYPSLMRAIEVSVDSLEPGERRHYLEMAVFPKDTEVPEETLQLLWGLDQYDAADLADHFADRSLARLNSRRLSLHDLQHDFALRALRRAGDLEALHRKLVDSYGCSGVWHTCPDDGYILQHLGYHLLHSDRKKELKGLLLDLRWMEARLEKTDLTSLISDYDLLPGDEDLMLCRDCLRLSSHVLFRDSDQLAGQMLGRMQHLSFMRIKCLMEQAREAKGRPWLRPMTASLTPPGGALMRTLEGHEGWVNAVALAKDGRRAVSASYDKTLKVWDLDSGRELKTLKGHDSGVSAVALTNDELRAVSASYDKTLKVWDLVSGRELKTLKGHDSGISSVALTKDGLRAVSASADKTLKVWDLDSGRELKTLEGHEGWVNAVALTKDGLRAVSASADKTLKVWDLDSGRELKTLEGHDDWVNAVALTKDGLRAVSASDDKTLKVWDLVSGRELKTLEGHDSGVRAVVLTNDERRAVSASDDKTLKVWDLDSGRELKTLEGHDSGVSAAAITNDGQRALSASDDKTLKVWDLESGKGLEALESHESGISAVAITNDGRRAVSTSYDKTLKVWDLVSGKELKTLEGHNDWVRALAITNDGRRAISASYDKTLKVWDLVSGKELKTLEGHDSGVRAVAITNDGRRAVSTSYDKTLKVWDLVSGSLIASFTGESSILACAFAPDDLTIAAGEASGRIHFLRLEGYERSRKSTSHP